MAGWRRRRVRFVPQMESSECGAACLAMIADHHGQGRSLTEVRVLCGGGRDGVSAARLCEAARSLGLRAQPYRAEPDQLSALGLPCILHWEFNHFVVLERVRSRALTIVDPALGRRTLDSAAFSAAFTGVVLCFEPGPGFVEQRRAPVRSAQSWWQRPSWTGCGALLLATLLLEVLGLGVPAAQQLLIDHVLLPEREAWLWPLAALLLGCQGGLVLVQALRDGVLRRLQLALDLELMSRFVQHLLRLPLGFFQLRSAGDLLQRVSAQGELRGAVLAMMRGALDGLLVAGYAAMMLAYDRVIGAVILALAGVRVLLLLATRPAIAEATSAQLAEHGKELGALIEPLAAPEVVRAFGFEGLALERHEQRLVARLNAELGRDRLSRAALSLGDVASGLSHAAVVWWGGRAVLHDQITLGVFAGLITLQALLDRPLGSLLGALAGAVRARGALARLDDVLQAEAPAPGAARLPRCRGELCLQGVSYWPAQHGPALCDGLDLLIGAGEKIAIVGRMGQGKSTLLRLLTGLLPPSQGRVLLDGVPLSSLDPRTLAAHVGVVLQEPFLLNDSVRANLALAAPDAPESALRRAAQLACVDRVIEALPEGYDTVLGDDGVRLSGGERQRLALARALVANPRVLVLDEATSSLDLETEARLHQNLGRLGCTRILAAHRMETVRDADRILVIEQGRIVEQGTFERLRSGSGPFAQLLGSAGGVAA